MMNNNPSYLPVEWTPEKLGQSWIDLFQMQIDSCDGLPPAARAEVIRAVHKRLKADREDPSLLVWVDAPGTWYVSELKAQLASPRLPIAIIRKTTSQYIWKDFERTPGSFSRKPLPPQWECRAFDASSLSRRAKSKLNILGTCAKLSVAGTKEIASVAGISHTYARKILPELCGEGYIDHLPERNTPLWSIKQAGVQHIHQYWQVPQKMQLRSIRGEQKYAGSRHRRIARLFPSWLEEAYKDNWQPWAAWTEPTIFPNAHPDALVWGSYNDRITSKTNETLMWLEVEAGKKSRKKLVEDFRYRLKQAKNIAEQHNINVVFVVLGMPWVLQELPRNLSTDFGEKVAVVYENWRHHGYLAEPYLGHVSWMPCNDNYEFMDDLQYIRKLHPDFFIALQLGRGLISWDDKHAQIGGRSPTPPKARTKKSRYKVAG